MTSDANLSPMVPSSPPSGYPTELERWTTLPSGDTVFVRPVVPEDAARISNALATGDLETLRRRFLTGAPASTKATAEYLATVDYTTRLALVAMDTNGESVGIGRYEATRSDSTAEVAIVVAGDWRRRGVGRVILQALEPHALAQGIRRFVALYLPSNREVEGLLLRVGYTEHRIEDGLAVLEKPIA